jgi:hypothetical protein
VGRLLSSGDHGWHQIRRCAAAILGIHLQRIVVGNNRACRTTRCMSVRQRTRPMIETVARTREGYDDTCSVDGEPRFLVDTPRSRKHCGRRVRRPRHQDVLPSWWLQVWATEGRCKPHQPRAQPVDWTGTNVGPWCKAANWTRHLYELVVACLCARCASR